MSKNMFAEAKLEQAIYVYRKLVILEYIIKMENRKSMVWVKDDEESKGLGLVSG